MRKLYLLLLALLFCSLTPPNLWAETVEYDFTLIDQERPASSYKGYDSLTLSATGKSDLTITTSNLGLRLYPSTSAYALNLFTGSTSTKTSATNTFYFTLGDNQTISKIEIAYSGKTTTIDNNTNDYSDDTTDKIVTLKVPFITISGVSSKYFRVTKITVTYGEDGGGNEPPVVTPELSLATDKFVNPTNCTYSKRENIEWWDAQKHNDKVWHLLNFSGEYPEGGYTGKLVVNGTNLPTGGSLSAINTYPADILDITPPHLA